MRGIVAAEHQFYRLSNAWPYIFDGEYGESSPRGPAPAAGAAIRLGAQRRKRRGGSDAAATTIASGAVARRRDARGRTAATANRARAVKRGAPRGGNATGATLRAMMATTCQSALASFLQPLTELDARRLQFSLDF
jgi:hypothetical protein